MFQALRLRDFRLLWGAGLLSSLGSWLLVLAVPAHIFVVTRSLAATGLTLAADYAPLLFLGPVAGVLADRWDRRRLMLGCDLARAAVVTAMLAGASAPGRLWMFYPALAAESSATALFQPALRARVPAVTGTGPTLTAANALTVVSDGMVRIVGGPAGGVLLAVCGLRALIIADAVSYLASAAVMTATSPAPPHPSRDQTTVAGDLAAGGRALRRSPVARTLLAASTAFLTGNAALSAIIVPFGLRLGGSAATGVLFAALGVGFLAGAPVLRVLADRMKFQTFLPLTLLGDSTGYLLLFSARSLSTAIPAAVAIGLLGSMVLATVRTTLQRAIPHAALGRVSAVFLTAEAAATLAGSVAGPLLAGAAGPFGDAVSAALVTVATAGYVRMRYGAARPVPALSSAASARASCASASRSSVARMVARLVRALLSSER